VQTSLGLIRWKTYSTLKNGRQPKIVVEIGRPHNSLKK
jgi:hypothetical protein